MKRVWLFVIYFAGILMGYIIGVVSCSWMEMSNSIPRKHTGDNRLIVYYQGDWWDVTAPIMEHRYREDVVARGGYFEYKKDSSGERYPTPKFDDAKSNE